MENKLRRFLYLDPVGVSSLHTQLSEFKETERVATKQKKKSTSGKGRLSLKVAAGLFGGKGETEASHTHGSEILTEQRLVKEAEQKLIEVENALAKMGDLLEVGSVRVLAQISVERLPTFIRGHLPITVQGLHDTSDIVQEVIKSQTVAFELDQTSLAEEYSIWPHILIGGSLSKFESARDAGNGTYSIGRTSHLAVILRGLTYSPGVFGVFGHLQKTGPNLYIKPYAIWP